MAPQTINQRICQARDKLALSQAEFAKYFKVNQSTLSRWETGEIKIDERTLFWIESILAKLAFVYLERQRENTE